VLIALFFLFCGSSLHAYAATGDLVAAQEAAWDGVTQTEPAKSGATYQIGTGAELAWFAAQVNDGAGSSYSAVLVDDIDLGDKAWTPIGTSYSITYRGTFDGASHTVKGLHVDNSWAQAGLFGYVNGATIKNLVVSGIVVAENNTAGGIVSRADGATVVENCGNLASVENKATSGRAAGIVGWADGAARIKGCFNRAPIT
jgi:hypothetical protein